MEDRDISVVLSRILSGYYIFKHNSKTYKVKYPNTEIMYEADILAQEELYKNRFEDWIRLKDTEPLLISQGLWTPEDTNFLSTAETTTENIKVEIFKNFRMPSSLQKLRKRLKAHLSVWNRILARKHSLDYLTLEAYADNMKNSFMLKKSIYNENDRLVFDDDETEFEMIINYVNQIIPVSTFRAVARSSQWLYYWNSKKAGPIFHSSISEWTDEQRVLVSMSRMYEGAREHTEPPDDDVFDDDDAFDGWSILQRKKDEEEKNKRKGEKMLPGNLKNANEIFVVARSDEEINSIRSLNDGAASFAKQEKFQAVKNTEGLIREQDLPDVKRDLIIKSTEKMKLRNKR